MWVKPCHMTIQVTSSAVLSHALFMTLYKQVTIQVKHRQKYVINAVQTRFIFKICGRKPMMSQFK